MRYLLIIFFLFGCGYKPSSVYQKKIVGDKIYAKVNISVENPKNSIFLKDSLNQAIISSFNSTIVSEEDSNTKMSFSISSIYLNAIDYDENGYPILYRVTSYINSTIVDKFGVTHSLTGSGSYDFSTNPNSIIGDDIKQNATRESLLKAVDNLFNKISIIGMKQKESK